jgi:hypothetical protein
MISSKPNIQFSYKNKEKLLEDKKIDVFLNEIQKKRVNDKIYRQRNRKKKLYFESMLFLNIGQNSYKKKSTEKII